MHYKIDEMDEYGNPELMALRSKQLEVEARLPPPQWVNCDLRHFDLTIFGNCDVLMVDPPWDIHMNVS